MADCIAVDLGLVPYQQAWDLQCRIHQEVANGERPDTLLLLEHPHVYTLGRRGQDSDILIDEARLAEIGAEVHHIDRGGEVTYHGPGQLVGYPIINLRRKGGGPLKYVRTLEQTLIATLSDFGIEAESEDRPTGVWIGDAKIAAIGVKVSRGVTTHGFALNVDPDMSYFDHIIACGMPDASATSVAQELGRCVSVADAISALVPRFAEMFGMGVSRINDLSAPPKSDPTNLTEMTLKPGS
jgi:lipoate-protein ligase B